MDSLFPSASMANSTNCSLVSPLGAAVVCVILLVLFYLLFVKGKFAPAPPAPPAPPAATFTGGYGGSSGLALRAHEQSQAGVGAGFQSGYEPPVFWGSSGEKELYFDQRDAAREERAYALSSGEGADLSRKAGGPAGMVGSDAQLLAQSRGY